MKKFFTVVAALLVVATIAFAQKQTVTKALVGYQIKNMGINTSGRFKTVSADIVFDKANLAASSIEASVDVNSIDSDSEGRDKHLKAEDFFNVATYPKMLMKSVSFKPKGGNKYSGVFNLTIKGKTKAVEVPFTYTDSNNMGLFKGSFKINRKDFGVGGNSMVLADETTIDFAVETSK